MRANSMELVEYTRAEALAKVAAIQAGLERKKKPDQDAHFFMNQVLDAVERLFIAEIRERQAAVRRLFSLDEPSPRRAAR